MDIDIVLPRLVATYESGRLVPFIGAGMSRPACTDWPGLVRKLEQEAGLTTRPPLAPNAPPDEIVAEGMLRPGRSGREETGRSSPRCAVR